MNPRPSLKVFVCLALLALGFTALGAMVGRRLPPLSASVESGVGELGRNFYPRFERELAPASGVI